MSFDNTVSAMNAVQGMNGFSVAGQFDRHGRGVRGGDGVVSIRFSVLGVAMIVVV